MTEAERAQVVEYCAVCCAESYLRVCWVCRRDYWTLYYDAEIKESTPILKIKKQ